MEALTWQGANYINLLAQLKEKYPQKNPDKEVEEEGIENQDQMNLIAGVQNIRSMVFRSYVKFTALKKEIDKFKNYEEQIKKTYDNISNNPIPPKEQVEEFIIAMNELFVIGIVGELLGSAGDVLRSLTK